MADYSHALEEPNEPLLRPRHPPRPESHTNNDRVEPPSCFKATDHTIRRSKSQHDLQVSKLNSRKVNFKVLRQRHFTCWSYNGLRIGWWFNHRHNVCCCTLSNKGPLAVAGKAQNTVCNCMVQDSKVLLMLVLYSRIYCFGVNSSGPDQLVSKKTMGRSPSCTQETCNLAVHLCMAIPKDFASAPTIGVCQIS